MREQLLLLRSGVPWDVIETLSSRLRQAYVIAFREMSGTEVYDFQNKQWQTVKPTQ